MKTLAIISLILIGAFAGMSIWRFGLQKSWVAYAKKWRDAFPTHNTNVWTIVTAASALLLAPAMVGCLAAEPYQFLGLLIPASAVVMACTPKADSNSAQRLVHDAAAFVGAALVLTLCVFAMHRWWLPLICVAAFFFFLAAPTRSIRSSWTLWLFFGLTAAAYVVSIIQGA